MFLVFSISKTFGVFFVLKKTEKDDLDILYCVKIRRVVMPNAKIRIFLKSTKLANKWWNFEGKEVTPRNVVEKERTLYHFKGRFCVIRIDQGENKN